MRPKTTVMALAAAAAIALPAAAQTVGTVAAHEEPTAVRAARVIYNGGLERTLASYYSPAEIQAGVYVGSEYCIACHKDYSSWRDTAHAKAYRRPLTANALKLGLGVTNDYDKNGVDDFAQGLDFNTISSVFDPYKPNAPKLSLEANTYYVTIGELKMPVVYTHGGVGDGKQRFALRVPLGDGTMSKDVYTSPVQYNDVRGRYVLYNVNNWYDATTKAPLFPKTVAATDLAAKNGSTQSKKCVGCHTTGIRDMQKTAAGEYVYKPYIAVLYRQDDPGYFDFDGDGNFNIVNIHCEACHGPGSNHILYGGDKTKIVNPAKMTTAKANEVCAQCHVRVFSVPNKTHEWPYKDDTKTSWYPGTEAPLKDFYTDAAGVWPDGITARQHHQQSRDLDNSSKPTFPFHPVRCTECHDPHKQTSNKYQIVDSIKSGAVTIPTKVENNTLCLACHATHGPFEGISAAETANYAANVDKIGKVTTAHTNHPYGPERSMGLSRCTPCHMPETAVTAETYDIASHTFEVISPEKTLKYQDKGGMPNSCAASCHSLKVNSFNLGLDPSLGTWNAPFDVQLATSLQKYFGPGGKWWNTTEPASMTNRAMQKSLPPDSSFVTTHQPGE